MLSKALDDPTLWVIEYRNNQPAFKLLDRTVIPVQASGRALIFSAKEPDLDAETMHQFSDRNPDALVLEMGQLSKAGLGESWLWSSTRDKETVLRWRAAAKQVKAYLLSGAVAVNPTTGESAPMKWHRFTQKAQEAYVEGVVLLPAAGSSVIKLPSGKSC